MSKKAKPFVPEEEETPKDQEVGTPTPAAANDYVVRKGIGVPPRTRKSGGSKYPLASLEVGDGIEASERVANNILAASRSVSKATGYKFVCRIHPEDKNLRLVVRSE